MTLYRLLINYLLLLTSPLWILPVAMYQILCDVYNKNTLVRQTFVTGKRWIWDY